MKKLIYIFLVVCIYIVGSNYTQAENFVKVGYNQLVTVYVDVDSIKVVRNESPFYVIRYNKLVKDYNKNTIDIWREETHYNEKVKNPNSMKQRAIGRITLAFNGRVRESNQFVTNFYPTFPGIDLDVGNFVFNKVFHRRFKNN